MPTYDYICTSCANAWELEQRIVEDPVKECPECGKSTAKRQISSGAGFILKGGGWYADGYGSKKSSGSDPASSEKPSKSETKADSPSKASDAKTESKSEAKPSDPKPSGGGSSGAGGDSKVSAA
ncbi:MAG TPA: zinc ribbon domain-containing protein [Polyangiaceae bacterium]|nr:zinc ribbon domain-containing protein [Polyangiaceae bacterium]